MYSINEKVSDLAGRKFAVYKAERGLSNPEALDQILSNLTFEPNKINKQETINK